MILAIVAGGKGTRLGLTEIPKPMAEIGGRPLLEQQILLAKRYGIREIYILSGHLSSALCGHFGNGDTLGVQITHLVENEPLGTAGAVKMLQGKVTERFLVFYGDVVMDIDLQSMMAFDQAGVNESLATLLVHPNDHPYDSDLVELDAQGMVTAFHAKPHPEGMFYRNLVNAAVYIFDPAILNHIPAGVPCDFGRDIFPALVKQGKTLRGYASPEYVKDMGTPDRFSRTRKDFEEGKVARLNRSNARPAIFLDRDGVINEDRGNLARAEDFQLLDGVCQAIRQINHSEYLCLVVTNQPVLAKGFCTEAEMDRIHRKMDTLLGAERAYVDGLYYCPHHPEAGFAGEVTSLKIDCDCRKPKPGLLLQAAQDFNVDMARSWMIGDRFADVAAGKAAGVRTVILGTGHAGADRISFNVEPDAEFQALDQAIRNIIKP